MHYRKGTYYRKWNTAAAKLMYIKLPQVFPIVQDDGEEEEEEEEKEVIQFSTEEQLDMLVEYLRSQHRYCLFCAIRNVRLPFVLTVQ